MAAFPLQLARMNDLLSLRDSESHADKDNTIFIACGPSHLRYAAELGLGTRSF